MIPDSDPGYVGPGLDDGPATILDTEPSPIITPTANPEEPPSEFNNPSVGPQPDDTTLPLSKLPTPSGEQDSPEEVPEVNAAGSVGIGTAVGGGFLGWVRPIIFDFLKPIVSALTTAGGIATGAVVSGVALLLYPRPMGGRPDTIVSQSMGVEIIASTGELIIDGETSGIHVIPVSYDDYGNPTGYGPATLGDAEELSNLLGAPVFVGEPLGQLVDNGSVVNNDGVPGDGEDSSSGPLDAPIPSTGNNELDEILEGTERHPDTIEGSPNTHLQTPISQENLEEQLNEIPGANVRPHSGNGVVAVLPGGIVINTYPARNTDGLPGYTVTDSSGNITHHGSMTGQ